LLACIKTKRRCKNNGEQPLQFDDFTVLFTHLFFN
jgi:hypothetical protein